MESLNSAPYGAKQPSDRVVRVAFPSACTDCSTWAQTRATLTEVDRWSEGEWQRGAALFEPHCTEWRPPPPGQPLQLYICPYARSAEPAAWQISVEGFVHRRAAHVGVRLETRVVALADDALAGLRPLLRCRLDAASSSQSLSALTHHGLSVYPWRMWDTLAFVPSG
ncbi:hypothetical protein ONE63_000068 [Megalurothrips usitatus]|uniref:Uncharacterized protein n=1 Tax=Megalurothrips usitatus TaxID=439358 RepID=A0AAV7XYC9_9NEOP|nr:hypothetical protein ONE63_000068 [Megalurothrips usitatus]